MDVFCQRHEYPRPMRLVKTRKVTLGDKVLTYGLFQCSRNPIDHVKEMKMSDLEELDELQSKEPEDSASITIPVEEKSKKSNILASNVAVHT